MSTRVLRSRSIPPYAASKKRAHSPSPSPKEIPSPKETPSPEISPVAPAYATATVAVDLLNGAVFHFAVNLHDTVAHLEDRLVQLAGKDGDFCLVSSAGRLMSDRCRQLNDYGVQTGDVLRIAPSDRRIFVKTLTGKTITVWIDLTKTCYQLKRVIEEREGLPPRMQRLFICGKPLDDDDILYQHGVYIESTVHLTLPLRG